MPLFGRSEGCRWVIPDGRPFLSRRNSRRWIRVSGSAEILVDQALCDSFAINGKPASSVVSVTVEKAYFQCQKALVRSKLWDPAAYPGRDALPSAGEMTKFFAGLQGQEFDGEVYDRDYPDYMKETIY